MKTTLLLSLAALAAIPARAAGAQPERPYALGLTVSTLGGGFDGLGVRKDSGSVAIVDVSASPELRGERWRLEAPLRLEHRQTFGADLSETTWAVELEPWYEPARRVAVGLTASALGASRPDWPDLYQRDDVTGALSPTDRFGWAGWRAGAQAYARPARRQHLRARYRFASYDYVDDPAFDPNNLPDGGPMHLTPRDNDQHQVDVSWRYVEKTWALALRVDYTRRQERDLLARTARTGSTRRTPASALYTTPKQETSLWEPSAELRLTPRGGRLELALRYGVEVQDDLFQGYYSYTQHHPRLAARLAVTSRLEVEARYEAWLREYGADGTEPSRLESGTRRTSSRVALGGELGYAVAKGLRARASVEWVDRGTNYPDYVAPGPVIDWDYTNLTALAGLEYRL